LNYEFKNQKIMTSFYTIFFKKTDKIAI